ILSCYGSYRYRNHFNLVKPYLCISVYYNAILWAYERGITNGTSTTKFSPSETCERDMMVTFLYRYATDEA
ncbi:MAG: S-layer homology domain-containing protein, partial [Oscillospiraceae bacterium]|nr:S-layer homology domain-containing protein [Oscillospiraceae bacterium]